MTKSLNLRQSLTLVNRKFDVELFVRVIVSISNLVFKHHSFISSSDLPMLNFLPHQRSRSQGSAIIQEDTTL